MEVIRVTFELVVKVAVCRTVTDREKNIEE